MKPTTSQTGAKLIVESSAGRRREYQLAPVNTVGRHPMQTIQVLDPQVSKEHVIVESLGAGVWLVRDLGSLNGTYVNGKRLDGTMQLKHRDRIRVGGCHMVFWDPQAMATGDHTVTIGDAIESSIRESIDQKTVNEFLPVDKITDSNLLRRDYEKLRLAASLHDDIALELRLEKLLPRILDVLLTLYNADRGVILLAEQPGGELVSRAVKVRGAKKENQSIALSKTMLRKVTTELRAVITNDAQHDKRFSGAQSVIISGIRSSMCAPLLGRDRQVFGVIHLDSLYAPGQFTERDLSVLQGVANQAAVAIENARLVQRLQREAVMRQNFEKMFSPDLVDKIISGELKIEKGGALRRATVMFTDIRGFTALAHSAPPQETVKLLNEYFEVLVDVIFEYGGTVDKFIGDSVMAVWGAPVSCDDGADSAVKAAVEIQVAMHRFNAMRRLDGLAEIHTGIGIDTGEVVAGYMGSSKTMSYTVVGDTVNRASRLCSIAEGGGILVSESARDEIGADIVLESQPSVSLKGFDAPVANWRVTNTWSKRTTHVTDTSRAAVVSREDAEEPPKS